MKEFEDICREFDKDPVTVEMDLYTLLKFPEVRISADDIVNDNYYKSLKTYLDNNEYITKGNKGYKRTVRGNIAKARGYVCLKINEFKRQKRKELNNRRLNLAFAIIGALASIIAAVASVLALLR